MENSASGGKEHDGKKNIAAMRQRLMVDGLDESSAPADPFALFGEWLAFAFSVGIFNAHAMALATVNADGLPSVRNVLYRQPPGTKPGIAFYTDAGSAKAQDLAGNPNVAAVFSWLELERQVRMEGEVAPLDRADVEAYFADRPPEAQVAMLASNQSETAVNRAEIEKQFAEMEPAETVTDRWNGYLLLPTRFEFWQGRSDRIHDRLVYRLVSSQDQPEWSVTRLQP